MPTPTRHQVNNLSKLISLISIQKVNSPSLKRKRNSPRRSPGSPARKKRKSVR